MPSLLARWVLPIDEPPIENGAVSFDDGLIQFVGPASDAPPPVLIDFGDAVITPGLVNAHTHLELSDLAGRTPPKPPLADWLARVVGAVADPRRDDVAIIAAVREGARSSVAAGVTTLGDITRFPELTRPALADAGPRVVSYGEVTAIGPRRDQLRPRLRAAIQPPSIDPRGRIRVGVSPHAPYSVEPDGLRACAAEAARGALPLAMHLAESPEESEFTSTRGGPLTGFLRGIGAWDEDIPTSGCGPVELADRCGLLTLRTVIAHANVVDDADILRIARAGSSVAYCPRTHAAFEHPPHRLKDMLAAGVNVCVATDSLASSPSLSPIEEIAFLRNRDARLDAALLIETITLRAARALTLDARVGSLSRGKFADIAVFPAPPGRFGLEAFIASVPRPLAVYVAGTAMSHGS